MRVVELIQVELGLRVLTIILCFKFVLRTRQDDYQRRDQHVLVKYHTVTRTHSAIGGGRLDRAPLPAPARAHTQALVLLVGERWGGPVLVSKHRVRGN